MRHEQFNDWIARARAVPIEDEIKRRGIKLRHAGAGRVGPCPKCGGDDRFAVNVNKQVFHCRKCGAKGDVISLVEFLDDCDFNGACAALTGEPPPKPKANGKDNKGTVESSKKIVVASFEYTDENGNVLYAKDRIEFQKPDGTFVLREDGKPAKTFRQRRPDPDRPGKWIHNVDGVPVVPYKLRQVTEAVAASHPVFVVEGEAKAVLLASWNVAATCCAGGAKKWRPEHSQYLRDADVVLVPDNDGPGWEHINSVGSSLVGIAKRIRVLMLPDLPPKGDVIDWAAAGGTREQLDALLAKAQDWKAPSTDADNNEKDEAKAHEDELLDALAKAKGLDYHRQRKAAAKELKVPPTAIHAEVKARREMMTVAPLYGHWITEPWPETVDGDSLLRDIIRRIRRHVVITEDSALAIALWIMLSWVHDEIAIHSPILNINSAEPESGKSTTMGLIAFLMPKCIPSVDANEAPLYRAIKIWQPSFAIDEFDSVLASDDKAALRSVINSGHTRGQGVLRCVGEDKTPELFPTFAPKAIGMCGRKLPAPTLSRCIFVELRRRKKSEPITKFKHQDDGELADLRSRLRRWAMDNTEALGGCEPSMPDGFENRCADNWLIQFAIADLAGLDWGDKARAAAVKIEGKADNRTIGVRLLADIKALFDADPAVHCMSSATIVAALVADPEKPWAEFSRGKPLTQNRLAKLLGAYKITSQTVSPPGLNDAKGYYRRQFQEAWSYYVS